MITLTDRKKKLRLTKTTIADLNHHTMHYVVGGITGRRTKVINDSGNFDTIDDTSGVTRTLAVSGCLVCPEPDLEPNTH
ncbi:MAG: hypothetical protein GY765_15650 [bacterium]|nr:hypothetical protein [bacterium]